MLMPFIMPLVNTLVTISTPRPILQVSDRHCYAHKTDFHPFPAEFTPMCMAIRLFICCTVLRLSLIAYISGVRFKMVLMFYARDFLSHELYC